MENTKHVVVPLVLAGLTFFAGLSVVGTPAAAQDSGYVALCSVLEGPNAAAYRQKMKGDPAYDATLIASGRALFPGATVGIEANVMGRDTTDGGSTWVLRVEDHGAVRLFTVKAARDGTARDPQPTTEATLASEYRFVRAMAAYIYFNELMADDRTAHRAACAEMVHIQLPIAALFFEFDRAFAAAPAPDAALTKKVRSAFETFAASVPGITMDRREPAQTLLATLGAAPPIAILYLDQVAGTPEEYDVVRIGTDAAHTYATFTVDAAGKSAVGPTPLCLTRDPRCARFYVWP